MEAGNVTREKTDPGPAGSDVIGAIDGGFPMAVPPGLAQASAELIAEALS
jgi:hypothetical protein